MPLIAVDPYFSVWSDADQLYAGDTCHWTGSPQPLRGIIRIDGAFYAFLGKPRGCNVLAQRRLTVDPLRSTYRFEGHGVGLDVAFWTPLLPDDLEQLSRPVSYIDLAIESCDGRAHEVVVYIAASPLLCVDRADQAVVRDTLDLPNGVTALRVGSVEQAVLAKAGDNLRIDWGHVHLAASPLARGTCTASFVREWELGRDRVGARPPAQPPGGAEPAGEAPWPCLTLELGSVAPRVGAYACVVLAYDDLQSVRYFGQPLAAYWRRGGESFAAMLARSIDARDDLRARCDAFDRDLNRRAARAGGGAYRDVCALACRQTMAAHKLVTGPGGEALFFSKECFSNGCMATVDVSYPSMPFFLLYNPELVKAMMRPVLRFAASTDWPYPFAPHDVGCYPLADGQVYGRREKGFDLGKQMPVEECGNMILMFAACAHREGDASFAAEHWPLVAAWAGYLLAHGTDPGDQLCTDDFAGHLAHNTNLAVKAIVAIGAYAQLCRLTGRAAEGRRLLARARAMAADWARRADDGGHYRLAFDQPGTWSLKYNLVWDGLLGLDLFSPVIVSRELAFYETRRLRYGIPLDNRSLYAKSDWYVWCASLRKRRADFERWVAVLRNSLHETVSRVPFTDWYFADTAVQRGFQHRSVLGGIYIRLLERTDR